jgi:hypothetical protein
LSPATVCSCTGDAVAADVVSAGRKKEISMSVWIHEANEVVDPIDPCDAPDEYSTEELRAQESDLEADIDAVENLIDELKAFVDDARYRISEIDDVLDDRDAEKHGAAKDDDEGDEAAEDGSSEEPVQVETQAAG